MSDLTPYADLARIIENLPDLVAATRKARAQSYRRAAVRIGTDGATLHRLEHGGGVHMDLLPNILRWMDDPRPFSPERKAP